MFFGKGKFVEAQSRLLSTRLDLVKVNFQNLSNFEVIVSRYSGKLRIEEVNIYPGQTPSDFDLISVVDISGSMYSKLTPLKVASKNLAELINEGDIRIGFVAYSVSFLPGYSTDLIKDIIFLQSVADSWSSQTTTCICCGINQAKNNFLNQSSPGRAKAMVLMSDGIANEKCLEQGTGNAKQDAINAARDAKSVLNVNDNFVLHTIGFGQDADETTLKAIANEGGGQYFKAANGTELIKIYDQIGDEIKIKYKSIETYVRLSVVFYNETDVYMEERKLPEVLETKKYSFDLPIEVAKAIAGTTEDTRQLEGALLRIITEYNTRGTLPTPDLATNLLSSKKTGGVFFYPEEIIKSICSFYGIKETMLKGPRRDASLVKARQICMYLFKKELGLSFKEIGNLLGGRDHTTVMHGVRKVENMLSEKFISEDILRITQKDFPKKLSY